MPSLVLTEGVAWFSGSPPRDGLSRADAERLDALPRAGRERFLRGRAALRALTGAGCAIRPGVCPDCGEAHGAPLVTTPDGARLHASVAHTGEGSLAAVSALPVGIDVESITPLHVLPPVRTPDGEDPLQHWTRIESVLKADGRGLRVDPGSVGFSPVGGGWSATLRDAGPFRVRDLRLDDAHVAAVAVAVS